MSISLRNVPDKQIKCKKKKNKGKVAIDTCIIELDIELFLAFNVYLIKTDANLLREERKMYAILVTSS